MQDLSSRLNIAVALGLPILVGASLIVFMNMTSPLRSGPLSVLLVFGLVYLLLTSILYVATMIALRAFSFLGGRTLSFGHRQLYYVASVVGLGPVFILALNTLGQLEVKDVVLVLLLVAVGCFYVIRRSAR